MLVMGGGLPGVFKFDQLHFHWGSEHTIDGERYGLELHMVHHETRFESIHDALHTKKGLAVLGILFHVTSTPNPILEQILIASEGVKHHVGRNQTIAHSIELEDLLPKDKSSYFRYEGSLTTPGCGESVIWTVFTDSLPISIDQVERFKTMRTHEGNELTHNFRSVKPLNARALVYVNGTNSSKSRYNGANDVRTYTILAIVLPIMISLVI